MPIARYYSSIAQPTTLAGGVSNANASIQVVATTGLPSSYPYTLALDYGTSGEELVDVTNAAGTTLTVTRGVDGTSAQSHSIGAVVRHVSSGRDFADFQAHAAATAGVHGVVGTLVGTSDAQTLANKTLTSPAISGATLSGTLAGTPTFNGNVIYTGAPDFRGASTGASALGTRVTGDTTNRLIVSADGTHTWGSGSTAGDASLGRTGTLALRTNAALQSNRVATTDMSYATQISTDTVERFRVYADGKHEWGPGAAGARDTNLYRTGVDTLKTDDTFQVAGVLSALGTLSVSGASTFNGTINLASQFVEDTTTRTTTSQTFVNGSFTLSQGIVVPPSGKVWVTIRSTARNSTTLNSITSWGGSGSTSGTVYTENDTASLVTGGTANVSLTLRHQLTGLVAGETLTVTMKHRVNAASTMTMDYRSIGLEAAAS